MGKSMLSIAEAGFGYVFIPKSFSKILSTTTKWQPNVSVQLPFDSSTAYEPETLGVNVELISLGISKYPLVQFDVPHCTVTPVGRLL